MPAPAAGHRRRIALLALAVALAALVLAAPAAMADVFTPESGGSPNADDIDTLYKIVLYVAIPIFLLVEGTLIWSLVKYRARRDGPEPAQIRGNTPLEMGWTVGAALILVVLGIVTFIYLGDIKNPPASGPNGLAGGVQVASVDQPAPPRSGGRSDRDRGERPAVPVALRLSRRRRSTTTTAWWCPRTPPWCSRSPPPT